MLLLGLLLPHPLRVVLHTSLLHRFIISLPLLCNYFPSPPNDSITMLNCICGAVLACAVSLDYRGGLCRGGQPLGSACLWAAGLEAGLWEKNWSELEIPGRSSPLTYLLLSPPNLLTFGKGESLQFAYFSKFPLSPVPLLARHGSAGLLVAPAWRRALTGGEEEGE